MLVRHVHTTFPRRPIRGWREPLRRCSSEAFGARPEAPRPTTQQLRRLFINAAVPFVAFGIVDQTVLIYAGEAIDATFGVRFGLPTLAAAACGQVFSDTTGVLFGGTIEALATKLGLPLPGLSIAQQRLGLVRRIAVCGSVCGVITGCLIGMTNLLFIDLRAIERAKRAEQLKIIMRTFVEDGREVLHCSRASLWCVDEEKKELWSFLITGDGDGRELRVPLDAPSIVGWVYENREMTNIPEVGKDPRWQSKSGSAFTPTTMICAPVVSSEGKVLAVVQLLDKTDDQGRIIPFGEQDEQMMNMLVGHARVVMQE